MEIKKRLIKIICKVLGCFIIVITGGREKKKQIGLQKLLPNHPADLVKLDGECQNVHTLFGFHTYKTLLQVKQRLGGLNCQKYHIVTKTALLGAVMCKTDTNRGKKFKEKPACPLAVNTFS